MHTTIFRIILWVKSIFAHKGCGFCVENTCMREPERVKITIKVLSILRFLVMLTLVVRTRPADFHG